MLIQKYDYTPLSRETIDGKRHYCLPDGSKVPSVTSILDKTKPQESVDALNAWRARMGQQKAQEITTEAANRGTRMHTYLERYMKNSRDLGTHGTNPYAKQSFQMAERVVEEGLKDVSEIWGTEVGLYFSGIYAGSTDGVGLWKGREAIIDFKQTNKPKKREWVEDYCLQLAAYGTAHNEMFGTNIRTGVIMMCSKDLIYQDFIIKDEEWDKYVDLWWDRVASYYILKGY